MIITVRDGDKPSYEIDLTKFGKDVVSFGRQSDNDIVLRSPFASKIHGVFYAERGKYYVEDLDSTNGLCFHGEHFKRHILNDGDVIVIQGNKNSNENDVEIKFHVIGNHNADNMSNNMSPVYHQPVYQSVSHQGMYYACPQGMMWYNFIIWVQLFFHAIFSVYWGITYLQNAEFDTDGVSFADEVLGTRFGEFYSDLSDRMYIYAIVSFLYAALCIVVRMELAGYKKNAVHNYFISILFFVLLSGFRFFAIDVPMIIANNNPFQFAVNDFKYELTTEDCSWIIGAVVFVLVYILANKNYFYKRKHLFVN